MRDMYVTMYTPNIAIMAGGEYMAINTSEIVSISFIHNYDTATHPIIRLRIYADLTKIQKICENPDDFMVFGKLFGGIYKLTEDTSTPEMVMCADGINMAYKGYIESKNIASSSYDQYINGIKRDTDLNDNIKYPLEIYCYNYQLIHSLKSRAQSIYKNTTVGTVVNDLLISAGISCDYYLDSITNAEKHDQILIPNMDVVDAISYIDKNYGLYSKGGMLYSDEEGIVYLSNTDVNNGTNLIPIYVENSKDNSDMSGMKKVNNSYKMKTMAPNVSVLSESDIERVLHGPRLASINLNDINDVDVVELTNLFEDMAKGSGIEVPNLLHKTKNKGIATSFIARLDERITRVDLSGAGFDIFNIHPNSRYNLIFASPMRGIKMNKAYRASYACHVLSPTDTGLFIAQTTMNLCTN